MQETWRWFGPNDTVTLEQVLQAGASGVVTALDDVPTGEVWPLEDIQARQRRIQSFNLDWVVVESLPVHQDIKLRKGNFAGLIENYRQSLRNLGECGIRRVCYNFMPVLDWTRTALDFEVQNTASALRFEMSDFVAYDVFILKRPHAQRDYSEEVLQRARERLEGMSREAQDVLERNIIAGLPGGEGSYDREGIREAIAEFNQLGVGGLRTNLVAFLEDVVGVAEEAGISMAIHPDDPPFSLFGLPRVVSTADDARFIVSAVPSPSNGLTMCAGSYGARGDNDLIGMVRELGEHIQFVHLRNIRRERDGSFYESEHLDGDNDIVGLVSALLDEEAGRRERQCDLPEIPMRPDHGHAMGEEKHDPNVRPGYSYTGRLKGLAELRGVIHTLSRLNHAAPRQTLSR